MRKLLLGAAAAFGATAALAGGAYAQTMPAPAMPKPPANTSYTGMGSLGAPPSSVMNIPASGMAAPNSFVVHLNGRLNWYAGVEGSSADNLGGFKSDPYQFQGYIRLYPGFDAVAANGLQYGVAAEIRMPGSGGGGGHAGTSPGSTSSAETLYWRRAYGYVGTPDVGTLRFGMGDGIMSLFQTGTFEGFNDGAWNGDVEDFIPSSAIAVYPFSDVGAYYTADRVVYLSPVFSGFQFGASFTPNSNNLWNGNCSSAALACNSTSAAPVAGVTARYRNMVDIGATYTGTFGPVGMQLGGGYLASQTVNYNGVPAAGGARYIGYSFGQFGATLTYAGFTVGGNFVYGNDGGDFSEQAAGGVDEIAYMLGAQYAAGPFVFGGSYFHTNFDGGWTNITTGVARTETDQGIAAGGTYAIAPGMALYLSYLYGLRHQIGWDFYTGSENTAATPGVGNNTTAQVFALGTVLKW
ncbi:MAG TPA: porin [Acetobacteraceae bacterium]|nr:porin [Acetobacteraceae bacterium]